MDIIVLRLIHILSGAFWFGAVGVELTTATSADDPTCAAISSTAASDSSSRNAPFM